jgi:hypothetical protein
MCFLIWSLRRVLVSAAAYEGGSVLLVLVSDFSEYLPLLS